MATKSKYKPGLQVPAMESLQASGLISELAIRKDRRQSLIWTFRINYIEIKGKNVLVKKNFSHYSIKMIYQRNFPPQVFINTPKVAYGQAPHLYKNNSLCLYKPINWQWQNTMSFAKELFPQVCLWLYYYEVWQDTGKWYGEEAKHDTSPEVLAQFHEHVRRLQSQN